MKKKSVSALEENAVVQDKSIFLVANISLVIFLPPAFIAFSEKVINLLLTPVALILDLDANLILTRVCNSAVLSKLKMRQEGFLPPVQSCATGIKTGLLNSAHRPKAIPLPQR